MTISWYGLSSFKITGKDITIITDPFDGSHGLAAVRGGADVVLCSDPKSNTCNNFDSITGNPFVIKGPGEYDIKEVFFMGAQAGEGTIYSMEIEGIRIAFLGHVAQKELTDDQKATLEGADIVLVPVGGKDVLDSENAAKVATKLEPFVVIPHSYKIPGLTANLDKLDKFLQEMGGKHSEEDKLTLKKKDLAGEQTQLIILNPQR
jgi:L-ascorbate metabolism protein UlaG (beta-lactamase superfamily)